MTKEMLKQYRSLVRNISHLEEQLLDIDTRLTRMTRPLSDMPKNKTPKDMTNELLAKKVDLQNLINEKLLDSLATQELIEKAIDALPQTEQLLMRLRYIEGLRWEEICLKINYGWDRTHHIHRTALMKLREI